MSDKLTPYAAHKIVNAALKEAGIDKQIPPQMMYNYTKQRVNQNKKPLIKFTEEAGVDRVDLVRWIKQYINKFLGVTEEETSEVENTEELVEA